MYELPPFDRRMLQQAAVFTYHVEPTIPLEPQAVNKPIGEIGSARWTADPGAAKTGTTLIEFIIAPKFNRTIRSGLSTFGIRYDTLFPDLDGLSRELNTASSRDFLFGHAAYLSIPRHHHQRKRRSKESCRCSLTLKPRGWLEPVLELILLCSHPCCSLGS